MARVPSDLEAVSLRRTTLAFMTSAWPHTVRSRQDQPAFQKFAAAQASVPDGHTIMPSDALSNSIFVRDHRPVCPRRPTGFG
jgi:hypothetical protein